MCVPSSKPIFELQARRVGGSGGDGGGGRCDGKDIFGAKIKLAQCS
jgi:hypothetical protein